ncbi:hypothetical protein DOTSEDRAFT_44943 [Dothistroma septosporum NZE10]|uniref:Glycosyl transferase CAP10 domain-containing protein n=1 Tax=Dothistroma septosporum (strain NZE10 / CBS 128990) TaxID=675120 RepID=M2Y3D8_DOTSN|nr:hypothetical protein DOTSEDRAFT_44943 [Dothistroma septosporum NZE10]
MLCNHPFIPAGRGGWISLLFAFILPAFIIWSFWYGNNSDRDDVPALLTQLIPAGHAACKTATVFECASCLPPSDAHVNQTETGLWTYDFARDAANVGLTDSQCSSAFPGLFEDVHQGVAFWKKNDLIPALALDTIKLQDGMTRALIYEGNLYILATKSRAEDHRRKMIAVLSAMHRALSAAQDKHSVPNIEFVFSIEDKASDVTGSNIQPLWVLARKATEHSFFLIPDFGLWAWDNIIKGGNHEIGPYDEVVEKALEVEKSNPFADKISQLVWRGKLSFAPKLRRGLLNASRGKEWSAVKELNWDARQNYLAMEDHCKYKFIAHVEGRSYSASLKYRQACKSVIVAHKLQYIQHHHYLLLSDGPQQNYVEVERDFSDLEVKMQDLLDRPEKAERIADNSVKVFRERYLTNAAEACYWRALWRGYGQVSEPAKLWHEAVTGQRKKRGLRYETFVLLSSEEMLDFKAGG